MLRKVIVNNDVVDVDPNEMMELKTNNWAFGGPRVTLVPPLLFVFLSYPHCFIEKGGEETKGKEKKWRHNQFQICELLLEAKADPSWRSDVIEQPDSCLSIWHAVLTGFVGCFSYDSEKKQEQGQEQGQEHVEFLEHLYQCGAVLNDFNRDFRSPLFYCIGLRLPQRISLDCLEWFCAHGLNPHLPVFSFVPPSSSVMVDWADGDEVDILDTSLEWCRGVVVAANKEKKSLLVHYHGWSCQWDEWVPVSSERIAPPLSNVSNQLYTLPLPSD